MSEKTTILEGEQATRAAALGFSAELLRKIRASATGIGSTVMTARIDGSEVLALSQYVLNGEFSDDGPEEVVTLDDEEFTVPVPVAAALHQAWAELDMFAAQAESQKKSGVPFPDVDGPRSIEELKADLSGVALPKRSGTAE